MNVKQFVRKHVRVLTPDIPQRYKLRHSYAGPTKTREREALLKRIRELDAEIAQHERNLREGEARLSIEQLRLKLRHLTSIKTVHIFSFPFCIDSFSLTSI
jgi:hypothetical protein